MGDWETEYHLYYDGWSIIETRDGSNNVLKQHLWGIQYIDELVQVALNDDPEDEGEDTCETTYWALQDANYNLLAIVESDGDIKERYEYTPYGQRTVFKSAGTDDPLAMSPLIDSQAWTVSSVAQPWGICDVGHQGLFFDKEWGLYNNRARMLHPSLGRFLQRDPAGYVDGPNAYQYLDSHPAAVLDPSGLKWLVWHSWMSEYGTACTSDPRDTFEGLAKDPDIMLSPLEYDMWLKEKGGGRVSYHEKPRVGQVYLWPNAFPILIGNSWWEGTDWTPQQIIAADIIAEEAQNDDRWTQISWNITKDVLKNKLQSKSTWGFAFFGHGNMEMLPTWGGPIENLNPVQAGALMEAWGQHHFSYVILNMCESISHKGVFEHSQGGRFKGFEHGRFVYMGTMEGHRELNHDVPLAGQQHAYEPIGSLIKKGWIRPQLR